MTDTPVTPEIRKLADTIVQRYLAHPDGSFYAELMAQIEPLIASAVAQAVQAERAKRGELIERACSALCFYCAEGDVPGECNDVLTANGRPYWHKTGNMWSVCDAAKIRALDPEATQAFEALREPRGTQTCPVCSENEPHFHLKEEIYNWLKAQATRFGYNVFVSDSILCTLGNEEPCIHSEAIERGSYLAAVLSNETALHRAAAIIGNYLIASEKPVRERERKLREARPKIVCLCGSTRFTDEMLVKQFELRSSGVLAIGWCAVPSSYFDGPHVGEASGVKETLDDLHKRIIDLCDEVFVLNIGGYIGKSTRSEIDYAKAIGKPVQYLEAVLAETEGLK